MASIFANYLNSNTNSLAFGNSLFSSGFGSSSSPFFGSSGYSFGNTSSGLFGNSSFYSNYGTFGSYGSGFWGYGNGSGTFSGGTTNTPSTPNVPGGTVIATKQVEEGEDLDMLTSDFTYSNGDAVASLKIAELPENGTLELSNFAVSVGQEITVGDFDNLVYEPDDYFDQTDSFAVNLSSDGSTYDSARSLINIQVLGVNDDPEIEAPSVVGVAEGGTATGVGAAIVGSFDDPDTGDTLSEVDITSVPDAALGLVKYTSDSGSLITITSVSDTNPAVLSATEAASLIFVASDTAVASEEGLADGNIVYYVIDADGESSNASGTLKIQVSDGDDAPSLPLGTGDDDFKAEYTMYENIVDVPHKLNPATDEETPDTLKYSIGGTDASKFNVDSANGQLSFRSAPDYEDADDSNKDHMYKFDYTVTDDAGQTATVEMSVEILDKVQSFSLTDNSVTVDEGSTIAMTAAVTVADTSNSHTFSLGDTNDSNLFVIDEDSGQITFKEVPDSEDSANDDDGSYEVDVVITDVDEDHVETETVTITVTDIHDTPPALTEENSDLDEKPIGDLSPENGPWTIGIVEGDLSIEVAENTEVNDDDQPLLKLRYVNGEASTALNSDPDLSFALTSSAGTSNFAITSAVSNTNSTEGLVTKLKIFAVEGAELDRENQSYNDGEFQLTLKITDNDDGTTAETVNNVEINNENEDPILVNDPVEISLQDEDEEVFGDHITSEIKDPEGEDLFYKISSIEDNFGLVYSFVSSRCTRSAQDEPAVSDVTSPETEGFVIQYKIGSTYSEYMGGELREDQMASLRIVTDYSGINYVDDDDFDDNPIISLQFEADDDFSDNDGADSDSSSAAPFEGTYSMAVEIF